MIVVPEIIIREYVEACFHYYYTDYLAAVTAGNEQNSMLYDHFGGLKIENLDYYETLKAILVDRETTEKRRLGIYLGYDFNRQHYPAISIILPSEENVNKTIGTSTESEDDGSGNIKSYNIHRFGCTYDLLITSDNANEVICIYHFMKCVFLAMLDQFTLAGLQNLYISGRDITMDLGDSTPPQCFHRTVAINFFYENRIRTMSVESTANDFISEGTPIDSTNNFDAGDFDPDDFS